MLDYLDLQDEIQTAVDHYRNVLPRNTLRLIEMARADLYYGPGYLQDGGWTPLPDFDAPYRSLDFGDVCRSIRDRLDEIQDVTVPIIIEDEDGEDREHWEVIEGTRERIIEALCGSELARYV